MTCRIFTWVLLFTLYAGATRAQEQSVRVDSLYSRVLQENRPLHIVFPKNYDPSVPCEVVYCLDDIADFLTQEWGMLQWEGFIPKNMIMVGITNTVHQGADMRDRDFTPTKTSAISGGADKFLLFIKTELMPYIAQKYHAKPDGHVLYGGSLGGLFVLYTFLHDPALFTAYIAIDPSLWWDNFLLHQVTADKFAQTDHLNNSLFIVGREGNAYKEMGVYGIDSLLKTHAPQGLQWQCTPYQNETHYSTNVKGFWEGLKFSYGGFYASTGGYPASRKIAIKPQHGIVVKDQPFQLICYNLMAHTYLHYTTDGTTPTTASPTLAGDETAITLQQSVMVMVKSLGLRTEYNKTDSGYFDIASHSFPPDAAPQGLQQGGLRYRYFAAGKNPRKAKPTQVGVADKNFDFHTFTDNFSCQLDGFIDIPQPGYYIFEMGDGNDGTKVYLSGHQVLGLHYKHGDGENFLVPLEKGLHTLRVEFHHQKEDGDLTPLYVKPEGQDDFPVPADWLYHVR